MPMRRVTHLVLLEESGHIVDDLPSIVYKGEAEGELLVALVRWVGHLAVRDVHLAVKALVGALWHLKEGRRGTERVGEGGRRRGKEGEGGRRREVWGDVGRCGEMKPSSEPFGVVERCVEWKVSGE